MHQSVLASVPRQRLPQTTPIVLYIDAAEPGGSAGYTVDLVRGLRQRGYRVIALCHASEQVASMRADMTAVGAEVHTVEGWDLSMLGRLRRVQKLAGIMRQYPDCLLLEMIGNYRSGGPITAAGTLAGVRAIVRADLTGPMPPILWRHKLALQLKDPFVDRIVVGADENREDYARLMGRPRQQTSVIHTGIQLQDFQPGHGREAIRTEFGYSSDTLVVGLISRLYGDVWRKGVKYFIEMAAELARAFPTAHFLIVGDGAARPGLEQQADELGIASQITFAGWRKDIADLLAAMDVFVMPSLYEGGPTVVLQAMAMARPVVATRVGMVPEVMEDGRTGLIVEPGDAPALAAAAARLLSDATFRSDLGRAAREQAERNFSLDVMVERYLEVCGAAYAAPSRLGRRG